MQQFARMLGDEFDELTWIERAPGFARQLVQRLEQACLDLGCLVGSKASHIEQ
jgi:hypothetical protein